MRRLPPVVLAAALLLLPACSTGSEQAAVEAAPAVPAASAPSSAPKVGRTPATVAPTPPKAGTAPAQVPITGTDPAAVAPPTGTVPSRLQVADVDIDMGVEPVGVDDRGDMGLPKSVTRVGWYEFGPRPADARGATVLAAHVDSVEEGLGPFARLRSVRRGAQVVLSSQDGTVFRYRVTSVQVLAKSAVPLADVFDREGTPRLTIVTCGGAYDRDSGYAANVVVTATPESGGQS